MGDEAIMSGSKATSHRERRQGCRRSVRLTAMMVGTDGSGLGSCLMVDVSGGGARLAVKAADAVPDEFVLWLSPHGNVRRRCLVMWRSDAEIGIRFIAEEHSSQH
jgi:hypothetical protein